MEKKILREGKEVGTMIQKDGKWVVKEEKLSPETKQRIADIEKALTTHAKDIAFIIDREFKLQSTPFSFQVLHAKVGRLQLALCLKNEGGMKDIVADYNIDPNLPGFIQYRGINSDKNTEKRMQTALDEFMLGFKVDVDQVTVNIYVEYSSFM